jgi:hypothetical protein
VWRCAVLKDRGGGLSPFSGGLGEGETPLPIPNRAVKPLSADGTWLARAWESRTPPVLFHTGRPSRAARRVGRLAHVSRVADFYARLTPYLAHRPGTARATQAHAWIVRRTGGRLGGRALGADVLVLRTLGRRSGQWRDAPVFFVPRGDGFAIVASNAASSQSTRVVVQPAGPPQRRCAGARAHSPSPRPRRHRGGDHRVVAAACGALQRLRALPVDRHPRAARRDPRAALSAAHDVDLLVAGDRAGAGSGGLGWAEARLRRGRRLAPPPRCPSSTQRPKRGDTRLRRESPVRPPVRVSPRGLVARCRELLLVDLPVDWIAVLEQEERTGQRERPVGALCERRCPS